MIKTVVVPLDGSRRSQTALQPAAWLARRSGADIRLLTTSFSADTSAEESFLERCAQQLPDDAVRTEVVHRTFPYHGIIEAAEAEPDAILCMSTRGRTGLGLLLLGSVADEVIRQTTAPVVLIGPDCRPIDADATDLVVCIDDASESTSIAPLAAAWAVALGLHARILTVIGPDTVERSERISLLRSAAARTLKEAGVPTSLEFVKSEEIGRGIVEAATDRPAALIVMCTHSRVGWRSQALGPVTTEVVRTSPCPVLVRPVTI
jgi:nucleotide-binding universal stress UspA family protein